MRRIDTQGRDVTSLPGLWDESDTIIVSGAIVTKTIEQWHAELDSASYEAHAIRLELAVARYTSEDPFDILELEVAYRNALARLHERQRRYRAAMTVRARKGTV